jgi:hypothetical protein
MTESATANYVDSDRSPQLTSESRVENGLHDFYSPCAAEVVLSLDVVPRILAYKGQTPAADTPGEQDPRIGVVLVKVVEGASLQKSWLGDEDIGDFEEMNLVAGDRPDPGYFGLKFGVGVPLAGQRVITAVIGGESYLKHQAVHGYPRQLDRCRTRRLRLPSRSSNSHAQCRHIIPDYRD